MQQNDADKKRYLNVKKKSEGQTACSKQVVVIKQSTKIHRKSDTGQELLR